MTTYNTGNPLGSTDVLDRYDNSENLDNLVNGPLDFYPDRFGVSRLSLQGIRSAASYKILGPYAAGLEFTSYNQVFSYIGEFYAPSAGLTLPYTTDGSGAPEIANFRSVGDAVLRDDLAEQVDVTKGAALLGRGAVAVGSIAELLLAQRNPSSRYLVRGYYSDTLIGGGEFYWDAASVEAENGGTIFEVPAVATGRFKRSASVVRLSDFGVFEARKPIADLIAAAASGIPTIFDVDVTNAGDTDAIKTTYRVESSDFKIEGVDIFSTNQYASLATVPVDFKVRPIVSAMFNGAGVVTDFDAAKYDIENLYTSVKHYYVDPVNGTTGGAGTELDPVESIFRVGVIETATPSAEASIAIHAKAAKYDQSAASLIGLIKPYSIKPWGYGKPRLLQGRWGNNPTWTNEGGGTYSTTLSAVISVFDDLNRNDLGDPFFYRKVAGVVDLVNGSWTQVGSVLYIKTLGARVPDIDIGIGRQLINLLSDGTYDTKIYFENIEFLGGAPAIRLRVASASQQVQVVTKNCRFAYAGGNGAEVYGVKLTIHQNSVACYNTLDGFNYHSDTGTTLSESVSYEVNCKGYRNGYSWSGSVDINNGSTAHDNCVMLRYGTLAFENAGPNIADVNGAYSYNFGCTARDSVRAADSPDKADFDFSGIGGGALVRAWMDSCSAPLGSSTHALTMSGDCIVKVKDCRLQPSVFGMPKIAPW